MGESWASAFQRKSLVQSALAADKAGLGTNFARLWQANALQTHRGLLVANIYTLTYSIGWLDFQCEVQRAFPDNSTKKTTD